MIQKDKQLLLKDLCARLPYNVVVRCTDDDTDYNCFLTTDILHEIQNGYKDYDYKPYLRPMNSMTEEEIKEYRNLSDEVIGSYGPYHHKFIAHCVRLGIKPDNPHECVDDFLNMEAIDFLYERHLDFDGDEYLDYGPRYDAFKAGAKWKEAQMLRRAVKGYVGVHLHDKRADVTVNSGYLPESMGIKGDSEVYLVVLKVMGENKWKILKNNAY